jgi:DNA polymerase III subunit beta
MKLTLPRDDFKAAVLWAARGLPARPNAPVLACMRIRVEDGKATFDTFDYETSARVTVPVTDSEDGVILVPGRLLVEIAKALPNFPVQISDDGTRATLVCGSATFNQVLFPPDEYPSLPELPQLAGTIGADAFAAAIGQVATAVGRDDTLPALTGIRLELTTAGVRAVATDRYRLSITDIDVAAWTPAIGDLDMQVLVPGHVLNEAAKGMTGIDVVEVYIGDEQSGSLVGLAGSDRKLTTRVLAGEYPKYEALLPGEFTCTAQVPVDALVEAVKRVALVIERNTPIRLHFDGETLTLEGGASEEAQSSEDLTGIAFDGDDWRISFNHAYLLDALAPLAGGQVLIQFTSATKPAVFCAPPDDDANRAPGYKTVLMPIRSAG